MTGPACGEGLGEKSVVLLSSWGRLLLLAAMGCVLCISYFVFKTQLQSKPEPSRANIVLDIDEVSGSTNRPKLVLSEGVLTHVEVLSRKPGVLMVHEIPGALLSCASGSKASMDILPQRSGRFSLHFHLTNGEQLEIATVQVFPQD